MQDTIKRTLTRTIFADGRNCLYNSLGLAYIPRNFSNIDNWLFARCSENEAGSLRAASAPFVRTNEDNFRLGSFF